MSDLTEAQVRDFARWLAPDRTDNLQLRSGVVQSFTSDKVNVFLSGSSFAVGIRKLSDVDCRVGDTVWILKNGPDYFIIGRMADVSGSAGLPTGAFVPFGGTTAPDGFLLAIGANVSRTTYARLFAVFGTSYGVGDGSTTFGTPDLRGRTIFGLDNMGGSDAGRLNYANTIGTTFGSQLQSNVVLHNHGIPTEAAMFHVVAWHGGAAGSGNPVHLDAFGTKAFDGAGIVDAHPAHSHGGATANNGGGVSNYDQMPPGMLANWLIKT